MKRSTVILLVCAVALLGVTLLVTSTGPDGPPAGISVPGYASPADLEAERARGLLESPLEIAHDIDEIVVDRPSGEVRLARDGRGADATWRLTAPVAATAVKYQVEKITGLFKTDTVSAFSTRVSEADLALYDLEEGRRIGLTLRSQGEIYRDVSLFIGRVEKSDEASGGPGAEGDVDTWVMRQGDMTVVHRIVGKDLRSPAAEPLDNLRDKKVFSFKPEDLTEVTVVEPDGRRVVLAGARAEPEASEGPDAKTSVTWSLTEPAGVVADASAQGVARSLANLRAKEFVPAHAAPSDSLDGAVWRVEAKAVDGAAYALVIADGGQDDLWARVEGSDELMKLNGHSANQLRKTVEELRDKRALDVESAAVTRIVLAGADGPLELVREGDGWAFVRPAVPYPADPGAVLSSVSKVTATRWARQSELAEARAALAAPAVRGAVTAADVTREVAFSARIDAGEHEGKRWGVVGDLADGDPFVVADFTATRFETTVDAMRSKRLFGARSRDALRSVRVTPPGGGEAVVVETPEGGGEARLAGVPEGGAADEMQVRTLFATAAGLTVKSFVSGVDQAKLGLEPDATTQIVLRFADGATITVRVSQRDDGADPYATVEGGPLAGSVFTLNTYQVKNLQKRHDELLR